MSLKRQRAFNRTGHYCFRGAVLCEHNLSDAFQPVNACTGLDGECIVGNKFSIPQSFKRMQNLEEKEKEKETGLKKGK